MRGINDTFINDLLDGELYIFLEEVKAEYNKYSLEIRGDYINIYYRGSNIVRISRKNNRYIFFFDLKYCCSKENRSLEGNPHYTTLEKIGIHDAQAFHRNLPIMREVMDVRFNKSPKIEREYQQNLQRENALQSSRLFGR